MSVHDGTPQLGPAEALLLETYGIRLLAYLCASDEEKMRQRLNGDVTLSQAAEEVLEKELVPLAQHVAAQMTSQPALPRSFSLEVLGRQFPDGSSSIGAALRRAAGGQDEDYAARYERDPVTSPLVRMALDSYPVLLAPKDRHWQPPRISLFQHPLRSDLQRAVETDAALTRLFPEEDQGIGKRGFYWSSLGRGASIQDVMFGEVVIGSAWNQVGMTWPMPTALQLVEAVSQNVEVIRRAVAGKASAVNARIVFTGFTTEAGRSIATPWGVLRPLSEWERELAPAGLEGSVQGSQPDGSSVTVSYAGEMVLETELPFSLLIKRSPDSAELPGKWPNLPGSDTLRRRIEAVQLAVTLATDRPDASWATARWAWQWTADPLSLGPSMAWSDTRNSLGFSPTILSTKECDSLEEWLRLVDAHWGYRVDIAVRRFLSAANARADLADRLVDSVIVWENLFGTSQGEPRLRISAALAWLLASGPEAREAMQIEMKDIYDFRSKIVHGSKFDESALGQKANSALSYARDALVALFRERPDVLALSDGAARSLRLIMGG